MLSQKYVKFIQFIEIFNQMSKDLDIGRLTNHEKDTLLILLAITEKQSLDLLYIKLLKAYVIKILLSV